MLRNAGAYLSLLLLTGIACAGDGKPAEPTAEHETMVRATVDEVSVDIVVRDKHGRPIRNLTPEEVQVLDDGASAQLRSLRLVTGAPKVAKPGEVPDLHLISLVFDRQSVFSAKLARTGALELLKSAAGPNVYFSVWQISGEMKKLSAFTTSTAEARQAILSATNYPLTPEVSDLDARAQIKEEQFITKPTAADGGLGSASVAGTQTQLIRMEESIELAQQSMMREDAPRGSILPLLALVRDQGRMGGRKTLVYFSEGLQVTTALEKRFQELIAAANKAGVSIYAVNASGLKSPEYFNSSQMGGGMDGLGNERVHTTTGSMNDLDPRIGAMANMDIYMNGDHSATMRQLATGTGGIYIGGSNDLRASMHQVVDDINCYYEATYLPAAGDYDGHFRSIQIKVTRPKVKVQSRSGYFAMPPGIGSDVASYEIPMLKRLQEPERNETILFAADVLRFGQKNGTRQSVLAVQMPLTGFSANEDDESRLFKIHAAMVALVKTRDGKLIRKLTQRLLLQGNLSSLARARGGAFTAVQEFDIAPGDYYADIAVEDEVVHKISTKRIAFSVNKAADGLAMSDVVMVRSVEPLAASLSYQSALLYQRQRVVPQLASWPAGGDNAQLPLFFLVYPDPANRTPSSVELELRKQERLLAKSSLPVPHAAEGEPMRFLTAINKADLSPGSYSVIARARQGDSEVQQVYRFEVSERSGTTFASAAPASATATPTPSTKPEIHVEFLSAPKVIADATEMTGEEARKLLTEAQARSEELRQDLPNLLCLEATTRFSTSVGSNNWKIVDRFTRSLRYVDHNEMAELVEYNGKRDSEVRGQSIGLTVSGMFGGLAGMVLRDKSRVGISWKGYTLLRGAKTHIFETVVPVQNSGYSLVSIAKSRTVTVGYKALIYIDSETLGVRRIELEAQDPPLGFPIRQTALSIDYDYLKVAGHDYLLPQRAELYVREGPRALRRNDIQYREYRRYSSQSTIRYGGEVGTNR